MNIKTGQGTITLRKLIAIYSISMVVSLPGLAISPILGKLETIFPTANELQLQLLESLPSFIIVPFILLAGRLSLAMSTRQLLITGLAIFFGCSVAYPLANQMWLLLLISGFLGIGAGMVVPFSTGLIADYFSGTHRTKQLGYVSAITNFTLVLATLFAGFLAGINWHLSFIVYCISGVSLYFSFYLDKKAPKPIPVSSDSSEKKPTRRSKWPIKLMLLYWTITLMALVVPLNLSIYMQDLKIGNYDTSGTLISIFFLAITLPGLFINKIIEKLKDNTNFIALTLMSIGLLLFSLKADLFLLGVGIVAIGIGYGIMQPIIYDKTAANAAPGKATYSLSLVMVMNYIAIIAYPFILKGLTNLFHAYHADFPFIFFTVLSLLFTVFATFRRHSSTLGKMGNIIHS